MTAFLTLKRFALALVLLGFATACEPEVGTKEWCDDLKAKPKGDWTANEAASFAEHCIL